MQSIVLSVLPLAAWGMFTTRPTRSPTAIPSAAPSVSMSPTFAPTADTYNCWRLEPGQEFVNPVNISSRHGYLEAYLKYRYVDVSNSVEFPIENNQNQGRFCYMITDGDLAGEQAPVLRAYPGETMLVSLKNEIPKRNDFEIFRLQANDYCLERIATNSSTNLHFHGFHSQPICHDDNVVMTVIGSGESFTYAVAIPSSQPPGLYWYHPHIHEISDYQVAGGASGVMVIEGIENVQPEVSGLPEQIMVFRYGQYPSLNFIPIVDNTPVTLSMQPEQRQFWRIANTMADNELNLTLSYNGVRQIFRVIAQDGVAVGYNQTVFPYDTDYLFLPTGGRVEVIVTGPALGVEASLNTTAISFEKETNDDWYLHTKKLVRVVASTDADTPPSLPVSAGPAAFPSPSPIGRVPENLLAMQPAAHHVLNFYQEPRARKWFLNVDDQPIQLFNVNADPAITGTQGTVEDWIIINNSTENHDFHIHQMHFIVLEIDGVPTTPDQRQYRDMVLLPHQTASDTPNEYGLMLQSHPIKIRVDFTGDVVGKFVMHCHILFHEDHGMMRIVEVVPAVVVPSVAPTPISLVVTNNDDDSHLTRDLHIAVGILAGAVGVLIIIVVYYCIFHGSSASAATEGGASAAGGASTAAPATQATHQPVPTEEKEVELSNTPSPPPQLNEV